MRLNKTLECGRLHGVRQLVGALVIPARKRNQEAPTSWRTPGRRSFLIASLFLCGLVISATSASQLQPASLCESTEKIVFNCTVGKASKLVSLCSSKVLTKDQGYLQYRFGLPGKIELEFPKQREQTQSAFKYSHYFRAQFDQTEISFTSDGYEYAIFDDYNGEQKPAQRDQGIRITSPGGKETTLNCRGKAKAQYADLAEVFPEPE